MISAEKFMLKYLYSTYFNNKKEEEATTDDKKATQAKKMSNNTSNNSYKPILIKINGDLFSSTRYNTDVIKTIVDILTKEVLNAFIYNYPLECDVENHKITLLLFGTEKPDTSLISYFHLLFNDVNASYVRDRISEVLRDYGWTISGNGFTEPYKLTSNFDYL